MSKQQNLVGHVLKQRYQIKHKLKAGGFGSVYVAKDLQYKNKLVAVKIMDLKSKIYAEMEFEMYQKIKKHNFTHGFIKHYDHGIQNNKYFLVMELLDKDLEQLSFKMKNKCFSIKTVLMIGLQIVDRLQAFHKIGYVHRDVKPDNVVIGFQEKNKIIYLIDYGLAKKINQVRAKQKGKLIGSLAYMSCRSHEGKPTGTSDDFESLIYALLFLATGELPWMKVKINTIADAHKILIMKKKLSKNDFKNVKLPNNLFTILQDMRSTQINQPVDYLKIKYQLLQSLKQIKSQNDFKFDWVDMKSLSPQKLKRSQKQISPQKIQKQKQKQENQKIIQKQIYQVYKFLQPLEDKNKDKALKKDEKKVMNEIKKVDNNQANHSLKSRLNSQQKINIKKNEINQKIIPKRPNSALNKNKQIQNKNLKILKNIQLYATMKYSGPNIMINKTAKHKI